ncbi:hypothetical protein [Streptomyces abikoensis]
MFVETVGEQLPHIQVLALICQRFPHLPAVGFNIGSGAFPADVAISLIGLQEDFEAWRDALGLSGKVTIDAYDVPYYTAFECDGTYEGASILLCGFVKHEALTAESPAD